MTRPVPVPDATSAAYWAAAAEHRLVVARCSACSWLTLPPDVTCAHCGSTAPAYTFTEVGGRGRIRSWTVMRQSFLPGFDVPFTLVDVELEEQAELRLIGRLLGGEPARDAAVVADFEDIGSGFSVPAWRLA